MKKLSDEDVRRRLSRALEGERDCETCGQQPSIRTALGVPPTHAEEDYSCYERWKSFSGCEGPHPCWTSFPFEYVADYIINKVKVEIGK